MNLKLTRRRFGQLAIASTAAVATGYLANRTVAQTNLVDVLYGIRIEGTGLVVQTLNLVSLVLSDVLNLTRGITLAPGDQLSGFTSLSNGTLVVAINPSRTRNRDDDYPPRIILLGTSPKTLTVTGLKDKKYVLGDIVGTRGGSLVGLVYKRNGTPPVRLASIDTDTGELDITDSFRGNQRVRNLTECPEGDGGTIYTTTVDREGNTVLADKQLVLGDENWVSGLGSMACSSSGEFFVLARSRYESANNLYTVDKDTGEMTLKKEFTPANDINKITFIQV
jgi:dipeptidyl aminopeptidase/acylaminoacyl peptidase